MDITNLNQSIINHETREKEESVQKSRSQSSEIISVSEKSEKSSLKSEKVSPEKISEKVTSSEE